MSDPIWRWHEIICGRKISLRNMDSNDIGAVGGTKEFDNDVASHLSHLYISTASAATCQGMYICIHEHSFDDIR
jgi:hypothetical protein